MYSRIVMAVIVVGLLVGAFGIFNSSVTQAAPPCVEQTSADLAANPELLKINCGQTTVDAETNVEQMFDANAARYTAMAAYYAEAEANPQRANQSISARYSGLAQFYSVTDGATDSTFLAANPELIVTVRGAFVTTTGT